MAASRLLQHVVDASCIHIKDAAIPVLEFAVQWRFQMTTASSNVGR